MKHVSARKILITLITAICLFSLWAIPAQAASVKQLCEYAQKNRTFKKDITGDQKADTIKFKLVKEDEWYLDKINVFVNGKKAGAIDMSHSYAVTVHYISLSSKNVFLQVYGHAENDYIVNNNIYKYNNQTKKLEKVLDFSKIMSDTSMMAQEVTSASGSRLKVAYTGQPVETGWLNCTYTFVYKNGSFKLKSNTTTVKSQFVKTVYPDAYGKYLAKNQFVADKTLRFYKTPGMRRVSFTANKNDIVTLKKIRITNGNTYLQFKKGTKLGWIKIFNPYDTVYDPDFDHGWFGGISYRLAG